MIDISRRDIYDPNKALWSALQNIKEAAEKYVSLPHKTISVQEILKAVGTKAKKVDIPKLAVQYVDTLIQKRIWLGNVKTFKSLLIFIRRDFYVKNFDKRKF